MAAAAVAVPTAIAKFDLLFVEPRNAGSGWVVTVRTRTTPPDFTNDERRPPFGTPLRLYLVPKRVASEVRSPLDRRLHFIGVLVTDRAGRGVLRFAAPPLDTGEYAIAAWCRQCTYRPSFHVRVTPGIEGTLLKLTLPSAAETCPVTKGRGPSERYGNGLLSTWVASIGTLLARKEANGRLFTKLGWLPHKNLRGNLAVTGERLDAPGRMRVLGVYWGHASSGPAARGSWASAVEFPSEGCWRITGRVDDVTLAYVVRVTAS